MEEAGLCWELVGIWDWGILWQNVPLHHNCSTSWLPVPQEDDAQAGRHPPVHHQLVWSCEQEEELDLERQGLYTFHLFQPGFYELSSAQISVLYIFPQESRRNLTEPDEKDL